MNRRVDSSNDREERETSKAMDRILKDQGCDAVVLGCTELPILLLQSLVADRTGFGKAAEVPAQCYGVEPQRR